MALYFGFIASRWHCEIYVPQVSAGLLGGEGGLMLRGQWGGAWRIAVD